MIRITKAGWLYIILTIFLGFSAVNTNNNLVFLIVAALLGFMGVSGLFSRRNLSRVEVDLELPKEVFARKPVPLRVTVRNARRFMPAFLLRVSVDGTAVLFPYVETGGSAMGYVTRTFDRRGPVRVGDVVVSSVYPFNFFVRGVGKKAEREVVVFPEPKPWDLLDLREADRALRGDTAVDRKGFDADTHSVRTYVAGDPVRHINWKASARTGQLKTKEFAAQAVMPVTIDLDRVPLSDIEERVSCVTYAVLRFLQKGIPVGLRTPAKTHKPGISAGHRLALLKELALYGVVGR